MTDIIPPSPGRDYAGEANELDEALDGRLREIRALVDRGEISLAKAAHQRIEALENHLAEIRVLREKHFGGAT